MSNVKQGNAQQPGLGGYGTGSVVRLDGGKRIRLDDRVDYWPATGAWQSLDRRAADGEAAAGIGMASMLAFLQQAREAAGQLPRVPPALKSARRVRCDHCGAPAQLHPGSVLYPDRRDLHERQFWACWDCNAWVGCHSGTDKPFGPLATTELREARHAAHLAFDPVWQDGRLSRTAAYDWLARELEVPRHKCVIGMLMLEDCRRVGASLRFNLTLSVDRR